MSYPGLNDMIHSKRFGIESVHVVKIKPAMTLFFKRCGKGVLGLRISINRRGVA